MSNLAVTYCVENGRQGSTKGSLYLIFQKNGRTCIYRTDPA